MLRTSMPNWLRGRVDGWDSPPHDDDNSPGQAHPALDEESDGRMSRLVVRADFVTGRRSVRSPG